jgi:hypothetical protein
MRVAYFIKKGDCQTAAFLKLQDFVKYYSINTFRVDQPSLVST